MIWRHDEVGRQVVVAGERLEHLRRPTQHEYRLPAPFHRSLGAIEATKGIAVATSPAPPATDVAVSHRRRSVSMGVVLEMRCSRQGLVEIGQSALALSSFAARSRRALPITEAELRLIASAAISGDNNQPVKGNNTPAANGTPRAL